MGTGLPRGPEPAGVLPEEVASWYLIDCQKALFVVCSASCLVYTSSVVVSKGAVTSADQLPLSPAKVVGRSSSFASRPGLPICAIPASVKASVTDGYEIPSSSNYSCSCIRAVEKLTSSGQHNDACSSVSRLRSCLSFLPGFSFSRPIPFSREIPEWERSRV